MVLDGQTDSSRRAVRKCAADRVFGASCSSEAVTVLPSRGRPSRVAGMFSHVSETVSSSSFQGVPVVLVFVFNLSDNYLLL